MYRELLIGCGNRKQKIMALYGHEQWENLTTLDINERCNPDVVWDLHNIPLPFEDDFFDELLTIEVLEHCAQQGDHKFFFAQFSDFWRIMKDNGLLYATVPSVTSIWCWGDPSHRRVITEQQLWFLDQAYYDQVGHTACSDFRDIYSANFRLMATENSTDNFKFILQAIKGSHDSPRVHSIIQSQG